MQPDEEHSWPCHPLCSAQYFSRFFARALSRLPLLVQLSGGEAGQERRSHDGESGYVTTVFTILLLRNFQHFEDVSRGTVWPLKKEDLVQILNFRRSSPSAASKGGGSELGPFPVTAAATPLFSIFSDSVGVARSIQCRRVASFFMRLSTFFSELHTCVSPVSFFRFSWLFSI